MAPHPPLFPPAAFERRGGLPPCEPSRFSSNPTFDLAFLKAAFDGDLRFVKSTEYLPASAGDYVLHFPGSPMFPWLILGADPFRVSGGARVVGRGAEGRRLAEMLGAVRDGYGNGLLHSAVLGGSLPVCRYLVEDLRMDVDDVGPFGGTPLTFAIGRQNVDLVRYFLDQGADVHKVNDSGTPPLHLAVGEEGSCEIVELLLSKGAYVDALNLGGTALHIAARHGRDDIMKVLLDHHADHKIALGGAGYTALFIATAMCSLKCVKLLLEAGADVDGACKESPLMIAATAGSTDILKCLVLAGADANIPDSLGRAPIEIAARSGRRENVEILFPVTSRIPSVRDWSVDGIISHVKSVRPAKKVMLASAKSRAHEAFKNGNYYAAAHIYRECML
ncbi:ankyrin repeat domain-containing protein 65-like [Lolium rigidum]|uniref:ankyrin repeat domain-containing protein 65-like n=1 Tax=Lolium rigidum TaxID=89674 RepID=UPI001F5E268B|nr:ankyrin repeat domain-containing protein 65-like [Lolium rigidum]